MQAIYLVSIKIYGLFLWLLSPFHAKARKWVSGRRNLLHRIAREVDPDRGCIWFHFASLGEFEQGRPVLEALRARRTDKPFLVTFYSPSGYEIRKNTPLADHVYYLPADTPRNARRFVELVNPEFAVFTKYEYWPCYFQALHRRNIPLYLISAIFRPGQVFFRWYGGLFRKALRCVTFFFTQNEESLRLLAPLGHTNAVLAGDTRFDRVVTLPRTSKELPGIADFAAGHPVLIAGSTWPADEVLLAGLRRRYPDWKFILAPHEIHEEHIHSIEKLFPDSQRYSNMNEGADRPSTTGNQVTGHASPAVDHRLPTTLTLIIDNIGMLSALYGYGHVAYIGGGFGKGIHNTLEAATYGIPVIFGPNYRKFQEAKDLIAEGGGFTVADADGLATVFNELQTEERRLMAGQRSGTYVACKAGATAIIMAKIAPV